MESRPFSKPLKLALIVVAGAILAKAGWLPFLWVFPLAPMGLGLWLMCVAGDAILAELPALNHFRILLWMGGLLYFAAADGYPLVGLALVFLPALLWILFERGSRFLPHVAAGLLVLMLAGHHDQFFHWSLREHPMGWRFSVHLLGIFSFFRLLSWIVAVKKRGERPGFLPTMEYFIAPAFWLAPLHASHIIWERMDERSPGDGRAYWWVVRGFLHSLLLGSVCYYALPWLSAVYAQPAGVPWFGWLALGPVLFVISYLDKSQGSYLAAGFLRLSGHAIEPDFRSPWLARDLTEYWRRFHSWIWEYYISIIYSPLVVVLSRRLPEKAATALAIFLTFALATALGHYISYRAGFGVTLALGIVFGAATCLHYVMRNWLARLWLGIPFTWLTVFFLYILSFPAFGLGWGWGEFRHFFGM